MSWEHAKEQAITAALLIMFFFCMAIIFADLWVPIIPYLHQVMVVVGYPVHFMLSIAMFLSILWNISFYLKRRKELWVARKLIRWVASQRNVVPITEKERERIDRVMKTAIWALRDGQDVRGVIDVLNEGTHAGKDLPEGWARSHYETAIDHLIASTRRDQVLSGEA